MQIRITGAWSQLLTDWLDRENLVAYSIRNQLLSYQATDTIPILEWNALLEKTVALKPTAIAIGLDIGKGVTLKHLGVLGYLVLSCNNLGEVMATYQRYERLLYGNDLAEVVMDGDEIELRWPSTLALASGITDEVAIAVLITFLRHQTDIDYAPSGVGFLHNATVDKRNAYQAFFGCPVAFNCTRTYVKVPLGYLNIAMPQSDPNVRKLLDQQAQALIQALPDMTVYDRRIQQQLARILPDGHVSVKKIACLTHQSVRTLQRRLAAQSLTWQGLLDRTRENLACQYMQDKSLSLSEIALLLGYSEQSAFNKAFQRWTKQTPLTYRKKLWQK